MIKQCARFLKSQRLLGFQSIGVWLGLSYSQYAYIRSKSLSIFISGKDADLLIHEATLEDDLKTEAVAKKHRFKLK